VTWLDIARNLPSALLTPLMLAAVLPLLVYGGFLILRPRSTAPLALRLAARNAMLLAGGFAIIVAVATLAVLRAGLAELGTRTTEQAVTLAGNLRDVARGAGDDARLRPVLALAKEQQRDARWAMLISLDSSPRIIGRTGGIDSANAATAARTAVRAPAHATTALARETGDLLVLGLAAVRSDAGVPDGMAVFAINTTAETQAAARLAWLLLGWAAALLTLTAFATRQLIDQLVSDRVRDLVSRLRRSATVPAAATNGVPSTPPTPAAGDELQLLRDEVDRTVTANLHLQRERDAQIVAAQKLEAVGQLSSGIAHEFNNLLAIVLANAGLMRVLRGPSDEVSEIEGASQRGAALVRKLLAFGRRRELATRAWDVRTLLRDVRATVSDVVPDHVTLIWPEDAPALTVNTDRDAFIQVLSNLVTNACEAMPGGGVVTVAARVAQADHGATSAGPTTASATPVRERSEVEIVVRDVGNGMTPAVRARAFEPFFTTKSPELGTGMGLAIVYGLVTQMGGSVTLRDADGGGTAAFVRLPVAADQERADAPAPVAVPTVRRLLLVEDDAAVRRSGARLLESLGYAVQTAEHGLEALHALEASPWPDVVVSDVMMPEMGGVELVRAIRQRGWPLPILLVSGYAAESLMSIAAADALTGVLPKPWTLEEMRAALNARHASVPHAER
jgi:signal transduction histidine kinase/ActR/RegA family two-component response regulator